MSEQIFWIIFERSICLLENFLLVEFTAKFLGQRYLGMKGNAAFLGIWGVGFAFSFFENLPQISPWEPIITILTLFLYALFFLNGGPVKKIVASVIARELTMISNSIVLFLGSYLFQQDISSFIERQDVLRIITVLLTKIIYLFLGRIILGFIRKDRQLLSWQWAVTAASLLSSALAGNVAISLAQEMQYQEKEQLQLLLIVLCLWLMCLFTYFLMGRMGKQNQLKMENALFKQQQEYQQKSLEAVKNSNEEISQIKHDMKNHMLTVGTLIQRRDYSEAEKACEELAGKIERIQTLVQTGNESIDAILNEKLSESKRKGIETKCSIFTELSAVNTLAFCTVLGNLMDNAIEAEEKLAVNRRRITVAVSNQFGFITLTVKNVISASVLKTNAEMKSSKPDTSIHGIGHKSVRKVMKDCGGGIQYAESEGYFVARARFPI